MAKSIRPLPIYPSVPTGDGLAAIKKAKAAIKSDLLVKPVRAIPGSPGRILAIREKPNFVCSYALVENPTEENLKPALEWILGLNENYKGYGAIVMLREIFGLEVTEIAAEGI